MTRSREQQDKALTDFARTLADDGKLRSEEAGLLIQASGLIFARRRPTLTLKHPTALTNAEAFYGALRAKGGLFHPRLTQDQVDGIQALLVAMGAQSWCIPWAAYGLATAYHEVNRTMQPIKEMGGAAYFKRMYDIEGQRPHVARELGNTQPGDGVKFAGRGFVQLTGRRNYKKAGDKLGVDLISSPDKAMDCDIASIILCFGMEEGWFTGKKLADYLPANGTALLGQYQQARRIINGTDRAVLIAGYALQWQAALKAGGWK